MQNVRKLHSDGEYYKLKACKNCDVAINGDKEGRPYYGAGDHLGLWYFPYGGTVEIGVNKWHHLTVSSVKEDGIV